MVGNVRLYFVIAVVNVFCTTLTVLFVTNSLGGRCDDRPGFYVFLGQSFQSVYISAKRQKSETKMDLYLYRFGINLLLQALRWFWSNPTQSMDRLFKVEVAGISFQILISSLGISFQRSSEKNSIFSSTCQQH